MFNRVIIRIKALQGKKTVAGLLFLFLSFFSSVNLYAAAPVLLEEGKSNFPIGLHLEILEDPKGQLTISDVISEDVSQKFIQSTDPTPSYGFSTSAYWVRFKLVNPYMKPWSLFLESNWSHHDAIDFYIFDGGKKINEKKAGDLFPYNQREIKHRNIIFPLDIAPDTQLTIYLRFKSEASMLIPLTLWNPTKFYQYTNTSNYFLGLYYGALMIMILYNLFIFFAVKEKKYYLYYVFFISSLLLIQISLDGLGYEYLWPSSPDWANKCVNIFILIGVFWGTIFCQKFLNTKIHVPKLDKFLTFFLLTTLPGILLMFFIRVSIAGKIASSVGALFSMLLLITGFTCLLKGVREARYFFSASLFLFAGMILVALGYGGFLERNFITTFAVHIGTTVQALLLSFGLADLINTLQKDHLLVHKVNLQMEKQFSEKLKREIEVKTLDLSQQKIKLEQANEELTELDTLKSNFFANLSHELRTPLTLIRGWTEYIIDGEQGEISNEQTQTLNNINVQNLNLMDKINQMLKLSKFDAGMMRLTLNEIDIDNFMYEIISSFKGLTDHSGVGLNYTCELKHNDVLIDKEKLRDTINNLIRNAYKFTEKGEIKITLSGNRDMVIIEVADTGVGMSQKMVQNIFKRFHQGDSSKTRLYEGTGLGLAIVKDSVEMMHGKISVESIENKGSIFTVELPRNLEQLEPDAHIERRRRDRRITDQHFDHADRRKEARRETDLATIDNSDIAYISAADIKIAELGTIQKIAAKNSKGTLVIAEDSKGIQDLLCGVLKDYTLLVAPNGKLAWEVIQEEIPDIIISDIMMPFMDGYSLVKKVKSNDKTKDIPIILITASTDNDDRIKGLQIGADDFLTKPFHHLELKARVKNVISLRRLHTEKTRTEQLEVFLMTLASAIESKDKYTGGHVERVANFAKDLAIKMNLSVDQINDIYLGTIVHDVGKIGIKDTVLNKPGRLTDEEFNHIKKHPDIGKKLLSKLECAPVAVSIAYCHHEKWDGRGYPRGIQGKDIPIEARITTVADFWDAITSDRPYRKAMPLEKAISIMHEERGKTFDPELLDIFMDDTEKLYLKYIDELKGS
jgi:response regulator RpfG family c-di-GMP phosphodiesterase/signal transduction histidine kinase